MNLENGDDLLLTLIFKCFLATYNSNEVPSNNKKPFVSLIFVFIIVYRIT